MRTPSLPVWERGLKSEKMQVYTYCVCVAPRVGAWIEMRREWILHRTDRVAPRVGAWIEMSIRSDLRQDV